MHSAKLPSAPNHRLCNGDRLGWAEKKANLVHKKNWCCPSGKAVCLQMQMLRLLDGSEDSPHLCWKQANSPVRLWINRLL